MFRGRPFQVLTEVTPTAGDVEPLWWDSSIMEAARPSRGSGAARFAQGERVEYLCSDDGHCYDAHVLEVDGCRVRLRYDSDQQGEFDTGWMLAASEAITALGPMAMARRDEKEWLRDHKVSVAAQLKKALPADVQCKTVPHLKEALEVFHGARYLGPLGALRDEGRASGVVNEFQIVSAWAAFLKSGTFDVAKRSPPLGALPRGRSPSPGQEGKRKQRPVDRSPAGRTRSASREPSTPGWLRCSTTDGCDAFARAHADRLER